MLRLSARIILCYVLALGALCVWYGSRADGLQPELGESRESAAKDARPPLPAGQILVLGDSLSAGYQLPVDQAWPTLLEQKLATFGMPYPVTNAAISGDTSAGGLRRLPPLLESVQPVLVLIQLGANDALRGQDLEQTRANLGRMITLSQNAGAQAALLGMELPPNYGPAYAAQFRNLYRSLAAEMNVNLLPFLLEPIALEMDLFLNDGLHPNAEGQKRVADTVLQWLTTVSFKLQSRP